MSERWELSEFLPGYFRIHHIAENGDRDLICDCIPESYARRFVLLQELEAIAGAMEALWEYENIPFGEFNRKYPHYREKPDGSWTSRGEDYMKMSRSAIDAFDVLRKRREELETAPPVH